MAPDRGSDESAEVFWGGSPSAPRHSTATDIGNIGELQDGGAGASGIPESAGDSDEGEQADHHLLRQYSSRNDGRKYPEFHDAGGRSFTLRGVVVGLGVGVLISFSNTYLGLQSGWVSGMTMPASLIGFAIFKVMAKHLSYPFTPVEVMMPIKPAFLCLND
ncbi:MAG: hypothetical protein M1837_007173 [Sclerophora amabilis]|nr:MAG: hypothetical protein M1837_007173 [Sclerophora amabilis]